MGAGMIVISRDGDERAGAGQGVDPRAKEKAIRAGAGAGIVRLLVGKISVDAATKSSCQSRNVHNVTIES